MSMFTKPHDLLHPFTSYILCFFFSKFFFRLWSSTSTSFLPSYRVSCLSPSIFCLLVLVLATTHLSHISSFSFVLYPYLLLSNRRRVVVVVVIPTASVRISPSSTSSLHQMLGTIFDPTPLYNLNLVFQLPLLLPLAFCYLL